MSVPDPVGRVHYDQPRAVVVREPENLDSHHSAIHCGVNVYVDSLNQGKFLLDNWNFVMEAISDRVESLLKDFDETSMGETNT